MPSKSKKLQKHFTELRSFFGKKHSKKLLNKMFYNSLLHENMNDIESRDEMILLHIFLKKIINV